MFDLSLLPKRAVTVEPYRTDQTEYKLRLDANESYLPVPQRILEQFHALIRTFPFPRYPDPNSRELIGAFADFYGLEKDGVTAGNGSDELISLIVNCFTEQNDTILTFEPDFSMYGFYARLSGRRVLCLSKREDFSVDFKGAQRLIEAEKPRLVLFSNPCNPTGRREHKKSVARLVLSHPRTIFVLDEAYMDFAPETNGVARREQSFLWECARHPNLIVLKTLSKAFGCASLRLGFAVGDANSAYVLRSVKSPYNVNGISQGFGEILLRETKLLRDAASQIIASTAYLYDRLTRAAFPGFDVLPTEANFVAVKTKQADWIQSQLREKGILIRSIPVSGGLLRVTAGNKTQTDSLLCAMTDLMIS